MRVYLLFAVILCSVMAFFAVQNAQLTQVRFFGRFFEGPLVIVLLLTFGAGAVAAFFALLPASIRKSMEISRLKTRLAESEARRSPIPTPAPDDPVPGDDRP